MAGHLHPTGHMSDQVSNKNKTKKGTIKHKIEVWLATG